MGFGVPVVFARQNEVEVMQDVRVAMNKVEVFLQATGDDGHLTAAVQGAQGVRDAGQGRDALREELGIAAVALSAHVLEGGGRRALVAGQVKGAAAFPQGNADELLAAQHDARFGQNLAGGLKIKGFGVDQHPVIVPENRLDHDADQHTPSGPFR